MINRHGAHTPPRKRLLSDEYESNQTDNTDGHDHENFADPSHYNEDSNSNNGGGVGTDVDDSGYDSAPPFLPLEEQNLLSDGNMHTSNSNHINDDKRSNDDDDDDNDYVETDKESDNGADEETSTPLYTVKDHSFPDKNSKKNKKGQQQQRIRRRGKGKGGGNQRKKLLRTVRKYVPKSCRKLPMPKITMKSFVSYLMFTILGLVFWDALFTPPERRWIKPESSMLLLDWVQNHPLQGLIWILLVIAACVVVMIPLGTPLTLGCGYVYKGAYGWKLGVTIATCVSMAGSALGAVICFLLGRYLMRDTVRTWVKRYPLFTAIDIASAEHGLRIMAMLYLTPILPLGPVSYMCGTTSMPLSSFVLAKVAATPLMLLYVFIGASTGALIGKDAAAQVKEIEENEYLIVSGIVLSFVMIACITTHVRKELNKILERQKKSKPGEKDIVPLIGDQHAAIEMGITRRRVA